MKPLLTILSILATAPAFATDLPVGYHFRDTTKMAIEPVTGIPRTATLRDFRMVQVPPAPQPLVWSAGVYWDLRTKQTSAVVLRNIGQIQKPFGLSCDFDVDAFAGADVAGNAVAGVGIGKSFNVAKNVVFKLEVAFTGSLEQKLGGGGIFTVVVRF